MYKDQDKFNSDIFLTYANTPLENNPNRLNKTLEQMKRLPYWTHRIPRIKKSIEKMSKVKLMILPEEINLEDIKESFRDLPMDFGVCALDDDGYGSCTVVGDGIRFKNVTFKIRCS